MVKLQRQESETMLENRSETIKNARFLFKNYNRIKLEISQITETAAYLSKTAEQSIDSDIYTASVSHGAGGTGSGTSADKVPRIAEKAEAIRRAYSENIYSLQKKKAMLERIVASIDIFAGSLEWTDKTILFRRFLDRNTKSSEEISNEVHLTASAVKKRIAKLMLRYGESVNFDISYAVETLK